MMTTIKSQVFADSDPKEGYDEIVALGARLAIVRNDLCLTQAEFAKSIGLSHLAYHSYERGKRSIPARALIRIAERYDVDMNWLIRGRHAGANDGDFKALEEFAAALDSHVAANGIKLQVEKRRAIMSRWFSARLNRRDISMEDVLIWIDLLRE